MAIPLTGPISLRMIQTEFGGTDPFSIFEYYRGGGLVAVNSATSGIPASGQISIDDFRGKAASTGGSSFTITVSTATVSTRARRCSRLGAEAPIEVRQRLEEALGAALHDREQHALLRAEVVVDRAGGDAGLLDERGDRRGLVALLGHQPLGRVEHRLARARAAAVRGDLGSLMAIARIYKIVVDITKAVL